LADLGRILRSVFKAAFGQRRFGFISAGATLLDDSLRITAARKDRNFFRKPQDGIEGCNGTD